MKRKKMTVEQRRPFDWNPIEGELWVYYVMDLDDAIAPPLGTNLKPEELQPYCDNPEWNVRIRWPKD